MSEEVRPTEVVHFRDFVLDFRRKELHRGDEIVHLVGHPFEVLAYLVLNRDRLVPKDELFERIWGAEWDKTYAAGLVDRAVKDVRNALGDDARAPVFIRTIRREGLRFIAPTWVEEQGLPPTLLPAKKPIQDQEPSAVEAGAKQPDIVLPGRNLGFLSRRTALTLAGSGAVLALGAFGILRPRTQPERAILSGNMLTALDSLGRSLWTHRFAESVQGDVADKISRVQVIDLEGHGEQGVLAVCSFLSDGTPQVRGRDELFYFASDGKVKWTRPCRPDLMDSDGKHFEPAWQFSHVMVVRSGHQRALWLACEHILRWPGCVLRVDAYGNERVQFANAGNIESLCHVPFPDGDLIAFCGENNAYNQAFIGAIATDEPPSVSPTDGETDYRYSNPPAGLPRAYILLPTSELSRANDNPYGHANFISYQADRIAVQVAAGGSQYCYLQYEFSNRLEPKQVTTSGSFDAVHQRFEREGRIQHPLRFCPELAKPRILRRWGPSSRWRDQEVPWRLPKTLSQAVETALY